MADFPHGDFWLAVVTVGPVLLLGNAVLVTRTIRTTLDDTGERLTYWFSTIASLVCVLSTATGLYALFAGHDPALPFDARLILYSMIVALALTFLAAATASFLDQ